MPLFGLVYCLILRTYFRILHGHRAQSLQAKSHLYTQLSEISTGVEHIRAFSWIDRYMEHVYVTLDNVQTANYLLRCAHAWMWSHSDNLAMAAAMLVVYAALFHSDTTSPYRVGPAFISIFYLGGILETSVNWYTNTKESIVALGRLQSFVDNTPQEEDEEELVAVPDAWPSHGVVEFKNVTAKYE